MAKIVKNDKGFKIIELDDIIDIWLISNNEFHFIYNNVCNNCNKDKCGKHYYIAITNEIVCEECYKNFIENHIKYDVDDTEYENNNFEEMIHLLM